MTIQMKFNESLPFINLDAIHFTKNLPGYIHRVAVQVQRNKWFASKDLFQGDYLTNLELTALIQSAQFLRVFFSSSQEEFEKHESAGLLLMHQFDCLSDVLSAGEGDFYCDESVKKVRILNLLKMCTFLQMERAGLGNNGTGENT